MFLLPKEDQCLSLSLLTPFLKEWDIAVVSFNPQQFAFSQTWLGASKGMIHHFDQQPTCTATLIIQKS
jgi:hypothetical protein